MSELKIELISRLDCDNLYIFERDNREYFEESLPSRGDDYYNLNNFYKTIEKIITSIQFGESYMYLIKDGSDTIVGRVNLHRIEDDVLNVAEIGYRIGKDEKGKSYATRAVERILNLAFDKYNFDKVVAGTASDNEASKRVLLKNGFSFIKEIKEDVEVNGKWVDSYIYEKYRQE